MVGTVTLGRHAITVRRRYEIGDPMLNSIYFVLTLAVVIMLLVWSLKNDKAASIKDQKGLFAMRVPDGKSRGGTKKQPYVPGQNAAEAQAGPGAGPSPESGGEPQA
jgi:hypothetical protein